MAVESRRFASKSDYGQELNGRCDGDAKFSAGLARILNKNPNLGVVLVHLHDNSLGVYSARQVKATAPQDLFDAVNHLLHHSELTIGQATRLLG